MGGRSAGGPAPLPSPLGGRSSGNPLPARPAHSAAPQRASSRPRGPRALPGGRRPPSRTPTAEPALDSRVRGRSPARRRPARLPRLLTVGARVLRGRGAAAAAAADAELGTLSATRPPSSEPTEPRRLCLQGLSPARTLDKHFRGSGGRQGFGTGTAPGLELPGLPGGAGPPSLAPADPPPPRGAPR
ncbi:hypothetical protein NN561_008145 [Cricetulus griseus]